MDGIGLKSQNRKELLFKVESSLQFAHRFQNSRAIDARRLGYTLQNWRSILNQALKGWDRFSEIRENLGKDDALFNLELRILHDDCEKLLEVFAELNKSIEIRRIGALRQKKVSWTNIFSEFLGRDRKTLKDAYHETLLKFYYENEMLVDAIFQQVELTLSYRKPRRV